MRIHISGRLCKRADAAARLRTPEMSRASLFNQLHPIE